MVPGGTDAHLPMEGGRSWGASGDKVDFQFQSMENYGPVGAERPDKMTVSVQ